MTHPGWATPRNDYNLQMSRHPNVLILGYSEAAGLLSSTDGDSVQALIAIHGFREFAVDAPQVPHRLTLSFDDCAAPESHDPITLALFRIQLREAEGIGLRMLPPSFNHAQQIVAFANQIAGVEGSLLCHCLAGVGRSSAAALICLATWLGPGRERDCMELVLATRPSAQPNESLIRFGDAALGRNGRLIEALNRDKSD